MKKLLFIAVSLLLITVTGYSQFYLGESLSSIKSKCHLDEIGTNLWATKDFEEGAYAYQLGSDGTVTNFIFVPTDIKWLKIMVEFCNDNFIIINDQQWTWYDTVGKVDVYLIQDEKKKDYYFAFILKWE